MRTPARTRYTLHQNIRFIRGKILRFYLGHFHKEYVARRLAQRKGECKRCGACCRLLFKCAYVDDCKGHTECRIYQNRPVNCRIFPFNKQHLHERDILRPDEPCGYYFEE